MRYTAGGELSTRAKPRRNYTKYAYYTDGLRVVLILDKHRRPLKSIDLIDWVELSVDGGAEFAFPADSEDES
jgi:hypothetical protein